MDIQVTGSVRPISVCNIFLTYSHLSYASEKDIGNVTISYASSYYVLQQSSAPLNSSSVCHEKPFCIHFKHSTFQFHYALRKKTIHPLVLSCDLCQTLCLRIP